PARRTGSRAPRMRMVSPRGAAGRGPAAPRNEKGAGSIPPALWRRLRTVNQLQPPQPWPRMWRPRREWPQLAAQHSLSYPPHAGAQVTCFCTYCGTMRVSDTCSWYGTHTLTCRVAWYGVTLQTLTGTVSCTCCVFMT